MSCSIPIKIPKEVKEKLDEIKIHPRQPYWEVIEELIKIKEHMENARG